MEQIIQQRIWIQLTKGNIPPITSRYVARVMQKKGVTKIMEVVKILSSVYTVTVSGGKQVRWLLK